MGCVVGWTLYEQRLGTVIQDAYVMNKRRAMPMRIVAVATREQFCAQLEFAGCKEVEVPMYGYFYMIETD